MRFIASAGEHVADQRSLELGDNRVPVPSMSFDAGSGNVGPSVIKGRAPSAPDELLVGPVTADRLEVSVGDHVVAYGQTGEWGKPDSFKDTTVKMKVVGVGLLPLGGGDRIGSGAAACRTRGPERLPV